LHGIKETGFFSDIKDLRFFALLRMTELGYIDFTPLQID